MSEAAKPRQSIRGRGSIRFRGGRVRRRKPGNLGLCMTTSPRSTRRSVARKHSSAVGRKRTWFSGS